MKVVIDNQGSTIFLKGVKKWKNLSRAVEIVLLDGTVETYGGAVAVSYDTEEELVEKVLNLRTEVANLKRCYEQSIHRFTELSADRDRLCKGLKSLLEGKPC